ncbi:MAG: response regulator [Myxococcales bacterium]|nr:response regulator [Myxococcales bacterium]
MEPAILYVDDDEPNLDLFRRCLDEDFRVLTARSGPEALEVLASEEVGVLVSDQRMEPMTGIELLAISQARYPLVTRMLLTAYSDRELLLAAIQKGRVDDYLLKPWQVTWRCGCATASSSSIDGSPCRARRKNVTPSSRS